MPRNYREQHLVDLCYSIGLLISDPRYEFNTMSIEDRAKWIRKQLSGSGVNTVAIGSSWGVLSE